MTMTAAASGHLSGGAILSSPLSSLPLLQLLPLLLLLTVSWPAAGEKMDVFRLPNDTVPLAYRLNVWPIIDPNAENAFTFSGHVAVRVRAVVSTAVLTLNADRDLNVSQPIVKDMSTLDAVNVTGYGVVAKNEQLVIQLDRPGLVADREYEVQIPFAGRLRTDMTGFYRSSYWDTEANQTKCVPRL